MKKTTKIRLLSFGAAFFLVLGGFALDARLMLHRAKTEIEYSYLRALGDLSDYVSGMGSTLKKAAYISTPALFSSLSSKLLEQSGGAKSALAILPFSEEKTERINRFLSQVGDYALSVSRLALQQNQLPQKEMTVFQEMAKYATSLSNSLWEISSKLSTGEARLTETQSLLNNVDEIDNLPLMDDALDEVAKEFSQFPALLYDGPFSDHIQKREAAFLENLPEISAKEASKLAAKFLSCREDELQAGEDAGSALEVFVYNRDNERIHITKQGGQIAFYKKAADISQTLLSHEEVLEKAGNILKQCGIKAFSESYYVQNDNQCTINFCARSDDEQNVLLYPDLIKVTVEMQEGGLLEYDATGYLMNHKSRELPQPRLTEEEAKKLLNPTLTVAASNLALIPTPGLSEVLCYEFLSTAENGDQILSYMDVQTGQEQQVFLLQKDDHGTLVI